MPDNLSYELEPLQKENYYRRPEVIEQIRRALPLDDVDLLQLVHSNELKCETLVYLYRRRLNDPIGESIFDALSNRAVKMIPGWIRERITEREDFAQQLLIELYERICDMEGSRADFAQCSFGLFIIGLAKNLFRKEVRYLDIADQTDSIDESYDDGSSVRELRDETHYDETRLRSAAEALATLPEKIRTAFILHYAGGWQIESDNPHKPTLATRFGISGRQIRNWLKTAEKILEEYRGLNK